MFIGRFCTNHAERSNVFLAILWRDDKEGMPHAQQYVVADEAPGSSIAIAERMEIFVETMETGSKYHGVYISGDDGFLCRFQ